MKSRGIYETPGGTILYEAHNVLESATLDKETLHYKQVVSYKYGELIYNGLWYSKLREAIDAFIETTQKNVNGSVKLRLYKGNIKPLGYLQIHHFMIKEYLLLETANFMIIRMLKDL